MWNFTKYKKLISPRGSQIQVQGVVGPCSAVRSIQKEENYPDPEGEAEDHDPDAQGEDAIDGVADGQLEVLNLLTQIINHTGHHFAVCCQLSGHKRLCGFPEIKGPSNKIGI